MKTPHDKRTEQFDLKSFEAEAISGIQSGRPLLGSGGVLNSFIKHLVEASLEGELDEHLLSQKADGVENKRNGKGRTKQVKSEFGKIEVTSPRDRRGDFTPVTLGKWGREIGTGFDTQILELYAMGNSVEDIRNHLLRMYEADLSTGTISAITNRVWEEVLSWQTRPLESMYTLVYLDAIHYKVRDEGQVVTKALYTVYGINVEGERDILSLHVGPSEGAHQWALYVDDLKRRGVEDVLFFAVDGLSGLGEGIQRVFPDSVVQRCIVHMVRTSLLGVSDRDRRAVVRDLRRVYGAADEAGALAALEQFEREWGKKYSYIAKKWRDSWLELTAFLGFGAALRKVMYTTNAVENVHRQMRRVTKTKGAWCTEKALVKQIYMSLMLNKRSWSKRVGSWMQVEKELIELYGDRFTKHRRG